MFAIVTAENSLHITINDNAGFAPTEALIIGRSGAAIIRALQSYAKRHGITPSPRIGYAIRPLRDEEA